MAIEQQFQPHRRDRVRVFIDFWNLQLAFNSREAESTGNGDARFEIDWRSFPQAMASEAARIVGLRDYSYDGAIVYASYKVGDTDARLKKWLTTWLDRQPGIQVVVKERRSKRIPTCPSCRKSIEQCPHCDEPITATEEKGIDTAMVTDMVRLAWEDAYDVGVVVSSDSDFVPAVEFLDSRGLKLIQAGFPPSGAHLATSCWASFDIFSMREKFRRQ